MTVETYEQMNQILWTARMAAFNHKNEVGHDKVCRIQAYIRKQFESQLAE